MNCSLSIDGMGCGTSKQTPDENHRIIQLERELQEKKEKMEQLKKENDARGREIENARQKGMERVGIRDVSSVQSVKKAPASSHPGLGGGMIEADLLSEISASTRMFLENVSG